MLLKSLSLLNFRQFLNTTISFSIDTIKNVTIIMGQNASGKTTLAQAFTWCLYGDTQFEDKIVLSKLIAIKLLPKEESTVKVEINLIHNKIDYIITRKQIFFKDNNSDIKSNPSKFFIAYKNIDGQQEFIDELKTDTEMRAILPPELSRYFFFDGERITQMSKDIQRGKSKEFSDAVINLLGLKAFKETFKHLKDSNNSLIKLYSRSFDSTGNTQLLELINRIEELEKQEVSIVSRIEAYKNEEDFLKNKISELEEKISLYKESENLTKQRISIQKRLFIISGSKDTIIQGVFDSLNKHGQSYFSKKLIFNALKSLSNSDSLDKGIPEINDKTIDFLIKRGKCICGNKIVNDNEAYKELQRLLEYIPPQSIGNLISQFLQVCDLKNKNGDNLFKETSERLKILRDNATEEESLLEDLKIINEKLTNMKDVGKIQIELNNAEVDFNRIQKEKDNLNITRGEIISDIKTTVKSKEELTLKDDTNRTIEIYKAYAEYLYDILYKEYNLKEMETRNTLETKINKIFKHIYNGGLSLILDENYFVDIRVTDTEGYNSGVETSTAQSISIIFAFIAGVIEMAKDNNNDESKMLIAEPYPLVMDAPLSSFDTTRIKTICDILPTVAQQVIIFIKDTDGNLAEQHMGNHVGFRYSFDKISEFLTNIVAR